MRSPPPSRAKNVICKVLILTHEATRLKDTDDYFARKFSPVVPFFIMSRSYKMTPECDPAHTLHDCWKDRFVLKPSTDHNLLNHLALQVMFVSIDVDLRAYRRGPCSCLKCLLLSCVFGRLPAGACFGQQNSFWENHTSWDSYWIFSRI